MAPKFVKALPLLLLLAAVATARSLTADGADVSVDAQRSSGAPIDSKPSPASYFAEYVVCCLADDFAQNPLDSSPEHKLVKFC